MYNIINIEAPDAVLSCGDWGSYLPTQKKHVLAHYSPEFLKLTAGSYGDLFKPILEQTKLLTVYGNHDILNILCELRNRDGSPCLLQTFKTVTLNGDTLLGVNGNVSGKGNPWNVTLTELRHHYATHRPSRPDIVLSHEAVAPHQYKGHAAMTEFFDLLRPRIWFTGHIHKPADVTVGDTRLVALGTTLWGEYTILDTATWTLENRKVGFV